MDVIGHTTNRKLYLAELAVTLQQYCTSPIKVYPDMFGEIETVTGRNEAITRISEMIVRVVKMTDDDWDMMMETTAKAVAQSDHPKHSIL